MLLSKQKWSENAKNGFCFDLQISLSHMLQGSVVQFLSIQF